MYKCRVPDYPIELLVRWSWKKGRTSGKSNMHACLLILLHNWKKFQSVALELSPNGEYSLHPKKEYNSSYSGSSIQFQFDHFLEKKSY